jgi:O-antigen/teichoic acid export membrane protein
MLCSLGIPLYAIRESSRVRDDIRKLSISTAEILILHTLLSIIGYIVVYVLCLTVSRIQVNRTLFILLSTSIFFTTIGVSWFYNGVEDFRYITVRNIIVKIISIILLFLLVHEKSDLMWYAAISVIGTVGNNIFNLFRLKKYVRINLFRIKELNPFRHFKPSLKVFLMTVLTSIYTQLNIIMIGFIKTPTEVGYYTGANKITYILLSFTTALATVILPRLSNLIVSGNKEEFNKVSQKSIDFGILICFPIMFGVVALSSPIVHLFCGPSYEPAVLTLKILSVIIVAISISNILAQILYAQGKENIITISVLIGAIVNFILNLVLIMLFSHYGAAITTIITEILITIIEISIGKKYLPIKLITKESIVCLVGSLVMFVACITVLKLISNDLVSLFIIPIVGFLIYGSIVIVAKNYLALEFIKIFKNKLIFR